VDCDDVTVNPPSVTACTRTPEELIYSLFEAEVNENYDSSCSADTKGPCADLPGFFAKLDGKHSFVGAYCNADFLVLWTHGLYANGTAQCTHYKEHLADVPRPPGIDISGSSSSGYEGQCVGRSARPQLQVFKIPITAAKEVENPMQWSSSYWPASAVGVMLSGLPLYPALDASQMTVWDACESSLCNAHVGMGFDLHHHGDPGPSDECLYSSGKSPFYTDSGDPHGFPTGFSADGYFQYARYLNITSSDPALDSCGGHSHTVDNGFDPNLYHYHSFTTESALQIHERAERIEAALADGTCTNQCDDTGECSGGAKCSELVKEYSCTDYYGPGKIYAGWCDKECGYGSCSGGGGGSGSTQYNFWQGPSFCWKGDVTTVTNFYEDASQYKLNYDNSKQCKISDRNDYQQLRACKDSKSSMYYAGKSIQPCNWF